MIKIEIFHVSPVFSRGLVEVFTGAGFTVVSTKHSSTEGLSTRVDVYVVDPAAVHASSLETFIARAVPIAPLLLTVDSVTDDALSRYASMGAYGAVDRYASSTVVTEAVSTVARGEPYWTARTDGARRDGGPPAGAVPGDAVAVLSSRERQVIRQIAHGRTQSQIARALGISPHTVDTYVRRIRTKLALGNKAELTRAAILSPQTHLKG